MKLDATNLTVAVEEVTDPIVGGAYIRISPSVVGIEVDRKELSGWGVKATHRTLAERLKLAGAVFGEGKILTDVNGKTYVGTTGRVLGRTMNADLKGLGF